MSLATFLLGTKSSSKKVVDGELDAIFHPKAKEDCPSSSSNAHPAAVKKKKRGPDVHIDEPDRKRLKSSVADSASSSFPQPTKQKKSGKNRVESAPESITEPGTSNAEKPENPETLSSSKFGLESSDEVDDHSSILIHPSLQKDKPSKTASRKTKYAPPDETKERRDSRTIFVGNLPPDVAIKRPLKKQLHRHVLTFLPAAKIESTRFRSIAFQTPTSKLPEGTEEGEKDKQPRQHERERASSWREAHPANESQTSKNFLTPSQKKKVAFINKDIHADSDSVHAYIVFAYPLPPDARPTNLPLPPSVMDPFEAARLAIEKCNGTMFLDRTLRVDAVTKKSTIKSSSDNPLLSSTIGDPKLTIFVGNLDFASKEEDLRAFFEGIVSAERDADDERPEDGEKSERWITRVRMIRDKDSQLGKGFAYVQFSDRNCVDEILALEPGKLKFAKRKLRIQRCRSIPSVASNKNVAPSRPVQTSEVTPLPPVPKGDPSLGDKLVKLNKEERKRVKAADVDRVARRMAKKKAKIALAKQDAPLQNKQRERVRKTGTTKKLGSKLPKKTSKGRMKSEKSIAKRNAKK